MINDIVFVDESLFGADIIRVDVELNTVVDVVKLEVLAGFDKIELSEVDEVIAETGIVELETVFDVVFDEGVVKIDVVAAWAEFKTVDDDELTTVVVELKDCCKLMTTGWYFV